MRRHQIKICACVFSLTLYALPQQPGFSKDGQPPTVAEKLKEHHIGLSAAELVNALRHPDGEVRSLASAQLAVMEADTTIPIIIDAMEREMLPSTRIEMARALALLRSHKGRDVLRASCDSPAEPSSLRPRAALYLLEVGDDDESCFRALVNMLESDGGWDVKIQVLSLLSRFKDVSEADSSKVRALCVQHLKDPSSAVRLAATQAFQDEFAIPDLQRAIAVEDNEFIREQMKTALRQLEKKKNERWCSELEVCLQKRQKSRLRFWSTYTLRKDAINGPLVTRVNVTQQ